MTNKVALIIPYFGQWPGYFNLYLESCKNNPWLDILFFTDCAIPTHQVPDHVKFIKFNLQDFSRLASKRLNMDLELEFPYKLCDFKPTYGYIFNDYITDYDYWAFGDIDLIYGDLQPFIAPKIKANYDIISNRSEIVSGSLTLVKNNLLLNELFKNSAQFLELLKTKQYEGLDETAHDNRTWNGGSKLDLPPHSFTYLVANAAEKGSIKASFESTCEEYIGPKDFIQYADGAVTFNAKSISYYHYVCNKNKPEFIFANWQNIPKKFHIRNTGFYSTTCIPILISVHYFRYMKGFCIKAKNKTLRTLKFWN